MSIAIKSVSAAILQATGAISWRLHRQPRDDIAVLMYHRVLPRQLARGSVQAGMFVEPETLDAHLTYLRKHFEILPLAEIASAQYAAIAEPRHRPRCAITFDDGWLDFLEFAYPIFLKHAVPATIFLPTDYIGTDRWFWTDRLAFVLDRMLQLDPASNNVPAGADHIVKELANISGAREVRLERMITLLKNQAPARIEAALAELSDAFGSVATPVERAFLSWDEVRNLFGSGLITFGSHTATHPLLTNVPEADARNEMIKSRNALIENGVVDGNCISFSYPNGNYSAPLSQMAREVGYDLAFITERGWHSRTANPHTIKRIAIHQDISATNAMLGARIANLI